MLTGGLVTWEWSIFHSEFCELEAELYEEAQKKIYLGVSRHNNGLADYKTDIVSRHKGSCPGYWMKVSELVR